MTPLNSRWLRHWGIGPLQLRKLGCQVLNQPISLISEKIFKKKSGYRVPVWVKSLIRTRTDNPIKLSVQVPEPKKINISVRVPENSVRVSGFWFGFLVSDLFEHPYFVCFDCPIRRIMVWGNFFFWLMYGFG